MPLPPFVMAMDCGAGFAPPASALKVSETGATAIAGTAGAVKKKNTER